jgi:hypothetical protein
MESSYAQLCVIEQACNPLYEREMKPGVLAQADGESRTNQDSAHQL